MESSSAFPPQWSVGLHWEVMMKVQPPMPADMAPRFVERKFSFRVTGIPGAGAPFFQIDVRSDDPSVRETFTLRYRATDFSLATVTRHLAGEADEVVVQNGENLFIDQARRLAIVTDFPVQTGPSLRAPHQEFRIKGEHLVQQIRETQQGEEITLQRAENWGTLQAVMKWEKGDPWWYSIDCTEKPPAALNVPGRQVASGYLLKGSVSHD